jgi:hypothetical protein
MHLPDRIVGSRGNIRDALVVVAQRERHLQAHTTAHLDGSGFQGVFSDARRFGVHQRWHRGHDARVEGRQ